MNLNEITNDILKIIAALGGLVAAIAAAYNAIRGAKADKLSENTAISQTAATNATAVKAVVVDEKTPAVAKAESVIITPTKSVGS